MSTASNASEGSTAEGRAALRVCHVGPWPNRGGGIASVTRMLIELQQTDPDLSVDALATSVDKGMVGKLFAFLKALAAVAAKCRGANDLVLHIHTSYGRSFARKAWIMRIAEHYGVPTLLHIHGSEFDKWYEQQSDTAKLKVRRRLDGVGQIIVVSDSWNEYVSGLTSTTVTTVHNAVDANYFAFDRSYADRPEYLVLFLGGVGLRRKGAFDLLQAIHTIVSAKPGYRLRVVIAGHGEIDEARKWIGAHGLGDVVTVPGFIDRDEKERLLREAHLFVLPSYHEGLPIALLESMASGLPIVISPVGGIPEAIRDHHNGILVPAGDVEQLTGALRSVLEQPALRESLGRQAQQTVRDEFDLPVAAATIKALYAQLRVPRPGR